MTGWCFQWRLSARRWWLGSGECHCSAERAWFRRGTSWARLRLLSRWMNRRNYLWHVGRKELRRQKQQSSVKQKTRGFPHRRLNFVPDLKTVNSNEQKKNRATNRNESSMPWKLELLSMNRIKENIKDIYVIYFWPDTEALCINLWNVLKKTERKS